MQTKSRNRGVEGERKARRNVSSCHDTINVQQQQSHRLDKQTAADQYKYALNTQASRGTAAGTTQTPSASTSWTLSPSQYSGARAWRCRRARTARCAWRWEWRPHKWRRQAVARLCDEQCIIECSQLACERGRADACCTRLVGGASRTRRPDTQVSSTPCIWFVALPAVAVARPWRSSLSGGSPAHCRVRQRVRCRSMRRRALRPAPPLLLSHTLFLLQDQPPTSRARPRRRRRRRRRKPLGSVAMVDAKSGQRIV